MAAFSITALTAVFKEVGGALQAAGKVELWNKLAALQAQIFEMQGELVSKEGEILSLKKEMSALIEKSRFVSTLTFTGYYYLAEGDPFPLCMACWDRDKKAVHLQDIGQVTDGFRRDCPVCTTMSIDRSKGSTTRRSAPNKNYWD